MATTILTAERLRELLDYDPETGEFSRRTAWGANRPVGSRAGSVQWHGYRIICLDSQPHRGARLAWLHFHGKWPDDFVDHINGDRSDDRIANLRDVTQEVNKRNRTRPQARSKSGVLGVTTQKHTKLFRVRVGTKQVGYFKTVDEAYAAYKAARLAIYGV